MHVLVRSSTSARPWAASPGTPVSDSGMESPVITYGRNSCAPAAQGSVSVATASHIPAIWIADLAKRFRRDGVIPGLRNLSFSQARFARRIDRACETAALDLGEDVILRLIGTGQRESIAGRDRVVAGAGQLRYGRGCAGDQACHHAGAGLGLGVGGGRGFRDSAPDAGVADDVNIGHEL